MVGVLEEDEEYSETEVAYHEAGHAVACYALRMRFSSITIISAEEYRARVHMPNPWRTFQPECADLDNPKDRARIEKFAMMKLAGPAAQEIFLGKKVKDDTGRSEDWGGAYDILDYVTGSNEETLAYVEWLKERMGSFFRRRNGVYFHAVEAVAKTLLAKKTLGYKETRDIITRYFESISPLSKADIARMRLDPKERRAIRELLRSDPDVGKS